MLRFPQYLISEHESDNDCQKGNYGRWPRVLYYVTLLFALLARNHDWLIGGALAAALTYSGGAAIHAW